MPKRPKVSLALQQLVTRSKGNYRASQGVRYHQTKGRKRRDRKFSASNKKSKGGGLLGGAGSFLMRALKQLDVPGSQVRAYVNDVVTGFGDEGVVGALDAASVSPQDLYIRWANRQGLASNKASAATFGGTRKDKKEKAAQAKAQVGSGTYLDQFADDHDIDIPYGVRLAAGITGDVALDPLTYLAGAGILAKGAKGVSQTLIRTGGKELAETASATLARTGSFKAAEAAAKNTVEKTVLADAAKVMAKGKRGGPGKPSTFSVGKSGDATKINLGVTETEAIADASLRQSNLLATKIRAKGTASASVDELNALIPEAQGGGLFLNLPGTGRISRGVGRTLGLTKRLKPVQVKIAPKGLVQGPARGVNYVTKGLANSKGGAALGRLFGGEEGARGIALAATSGDVNRAPGAILGSSAKQLTDAEARVLATNLSKEYNDISKALGKGKKSHLNDVVRSLEGSVEATERLAAAGVDPQPMREFIHKLYRVAADAGIDIDELDNYFPRQITDEARELMGVRRGQQGGRAGANKVGFERARTVEQGADLPGGLGDTVRGADNNAIRNEVNDYARVELGYKGDFYLDQPDRVMGAYIQSLSKRIGRKNLEKILFDAGILEGGKALLERIPAHQMTKIAQAVRRAGATMSRLGAEARRTRGLADEAAVNQQGVQTLFDEAGDVGDAAIGAERLAADAPDPAGTLGDLQRTIDVENNPQPFLPEQTRGEVTGRAELGLDEAAQAEVRAFDRNAIPPEEPTLAPPDVRPEAGPPAPKAGVSTAASKAEVSDVINTNAQRMTDGGLDPNWTFDRKTNAYHLDGVDVGDAGNIEADILSKTNESLGTAERMIDELDGVGIKGLNVEDLGDGKYALQMDPAITRLNQLDDAAEVAAKNPNESAIQRGDQWPESSRSDDPFREFKGRANRKRAAKEREENIVAAAIATDAASADKMAKEGVLDEFLEANLREREAIQFRLQDELLNKTEREFLEEADQLWAQNAEMLKKARAEQDPARKAMASYEAQALAAEANLAREGPMAVKANQELARANLTNAQANAISDSIRDAGKVALKNDSGLHGPQDIAEMLNHTTKMGDPEEIKFFLEQYDKLLNYVKAWQIAKPGFHVRNFMGGMFNNFLAGVEIGSYTRYMRLMRKYKAKTLKGKELQEIEDVLKVLDPRGQFGLEVKDPGQNVPLYAKFNPADSRNLYLKGHRALGTGTEGILRGSLALDTIRKGGTLDDALDAVYKFHFNYADLSGFERKVVKRIIPFYTWSRKNFPLQAEMVLRKPAAYSRYWQVKTEIESLSADNNELAAPWVTSGGTGIRLPFKIGGGNAYLKPDLPMTDTIQSSLPFNEENKFSIESIMSMTSPLVKTPYEVAAGKTVFGSIPLSAPAGGPAWANIPGLREALRAAGLAKGKDDTVSYQTSYILEQFMPVLGYMRRILPSEERFTKRRWNSIFSQIGIPVRTNTKAQQEDEKTRRFFENLRR